MPGRTARRRAVKHDVSKLGRPLAALAEVYRARVTLSKRSAEGGNGAVLPFTRTPRTRLLWCRPHVRPTCAAISRRRYRRSRARRSAKSRCGRSAVHPGSVPAPAPAVPKSRRPAGADAGHVLVARRVLHGRMLHGYAVAIAQDVDRGLALLGAAAYSRTLGTCTDRFVPSWHTIEVLRIGRSTSLPSRRAWRSRPKARTSTCYPSARPSSAPTLRLPRRIMRRRFAYFNVPGRHTRDAEDGPRMSDQDNISDCMPRDEFTISRNPRLARRSQRSYYSPVLHSARPFHRLIACF